MKIKVIVDSMGAISKIGDEIAQRDMKDNIVMKVLKKRVEDAVRPFGFSGNMTCLFLSYAGSGMCDIHNIQIDNKKIVKSSRRIRQGDLAAEVKDILKNDFVFIVEFVLLNDFRKAAGEAGIEVEESWS